MIDRSTNANELRFTLSSWAEKFTADPKQQAAPVDSVILTASNLDALAFADNAPSLGYLHPEVQVVNGEGVVEIKSQDPAVAASSQHTLYRQKIYRETVWWLPPGSDDSRLSLR